MKIEQLPLGMQQEARSLIGAAPTIDDRKFPKPRTNASNTGKVFEKELETTAYAYHSQRVAMIRKVDPPVRVFWKTEKDGSRRQVVVFLTNPWPDWAGCWTARGGVALLIEAKSTSTHRLRFKDTAGGGLKLEQFNALRMWQLAGAAVGLIWRFGDRVCLFTVPMLLAAEARGDKSLVFESGLPVQRGVGKIIWDVLGAMEKALFPRENEAANKCLTPANKST